jgi:peroxiredoxin
MNEHRRNILILGVIGVVALGAGIGGAWWLGERDAGAGATVAQSELRRPAVQTDLVGTPRPEFTLPDLGGNSQPFGQWDGQVVLVNFWATWCPPCRREMPDFMALREQYNAQGFEIVGVAIDDASMVRDFVEELGVNYPIVHGSGDAAEVSKAYGNRLGALPYSVLVDREGLIRFIKPGELHKEELETELLKLL